METRESVGINKQNRFGLLLMQETQNQKANPCVSFDGSLTIRVSVVSYGGAISIGP
jgi:hypothetical protein